MYIQALLEITEFLKPIKWLKLKKKKHLVLGRLSQHRRHWVLKKTAKTFREILTTWIRNSTGKPPNVSVSEPEILLLQGDCPNKGSLSYGNKRVSFNYWLFIRKYLIFR